MPTSAPTLRAPKPDAARSPAWTRSHPTTDDLIATGRRYAIDVVYIMRFIESTVFTSSLRRHLDDEQYRALQLALALRPA